MAFWGEISIDHGVAKIQNKTNNANRSTGSEFVRAHPASVSLLTGVSSNPPKKH